MKCAFLILSFSFLPLMGEVSIIDDRAVIFNFEEKASPLASEGSLPKVAAIKETLKSPAGLDEWERPAAPASPDQSVFVISSVFDCGKCDRWHPAGFATAWALSKDGLICTNYHVVESFKGEAAGVMTRDGKFYPILEVLLADKANDIAVLRVDGDDLVPLPLAKEPASVGDDVSCLSHPSQRFFHRTFGKVARYHYKRAKGPRVAQMSITANYAKGSSGGPILNARNEVVGMVSSTSSIYYGKKDKTGRDNFQMVMKNCVPSFAIEQLLDGKLAPVEVEQTDADAAAEKEVTTAEEEAAPPARSAE